MKITSMLLKRCVTVGVLVPFVSAPIVAHGALNDVVLMWGDSSQGAERIGRLGTNNPDDQMSLEGACNYALFFLSANMPAMATSQLDSVLTTSGLPSTSDLLGNVDCGGGGFSGETWLIFTTCSMIMGNGPYWMRWTVPPFAPEARMDVLDTSTGEGYTVDLESSFDQVSQNAPMAMGNLRDFNITGPGAETTVSLSVSLDGGSFTEREYSASAYDFSYQGEIGTFGGLNFGAFAQLGRIDSSGEARIVADAPGADVVGEFYRNFRDNVVSSTGADTLFGGMMRQMAGLTTRGIPVYVKQTNSVGVGLLAGNFGMDAESTATIKRIMVVPGAASMECGSTVMPEGVELVDLGEQMADVNAEISAALGGGQPSAAGGAGAPPGTPGQGDPMDPMSAINQAMQQMSPEEQSAMQQVSGGLGGLFGGVVGAALGVGGRAPASEQSAAVSPPPPPPPAAAPAGPSLSSALMTDNLAQSAQNMLQALGYDTGNADGDISIETTIAISQFQAEQGLEVTGEVTPQLVGILAAEVDRL